MNMEMLEDCDGFTLKLWTRQLAWNPGRGELSKPTFEEEESRVAFAFAYSTL